MNGVYKAENEFSALHMGNEQDVYLLFRIGVTAEHLDQ